MKKHSKALVFFAVSKQIPIVYSADRGRAETRLANINIAVAVIGMGEKIRFTCLRSSTLTENVSTT